VVLRIAYSNNSTNKGWFQGLLLGYSGTVVIIVIVITLVFMSIIIFIYFVIFIIIMVVMNKMVIKVQYGLNGSKLYGFPQAFENKHTFYRQVQFLNGAY
jgi:hypothetical protein